KKACALLTSLDMYSNHTNLPFGKAIFVLLFEVRVQSNGVAADRQRESAFLRAQSERLTLLAKFKRYRVQAVALMGRRWAVVEHVAEVRVAARTADLDPAHAVAVVGEIRHVVGIERLEEARPAGARVELRIRREQRQTAQPAHVRARLLVVEEQAAERPLGALVEDHVALFGREAGRERLDARRGQSGDVVAGFRGGHGVSYTGLPREKSRGQLRLQ